MRSYQNRRILVCHLGYRACFKFLARSRTQLPLPFYITQLRLPPSEVLTSTGGIYLFFFFSSAHMEKVSTSPLETMALTYYIKLSILQILLVSLIKCQF